MRPAVLVVEPYLGGSHEAWTEGLRRHLPHPVEVVSLPARWWRWRMRGGAVTLAEACRETDFRPDVVLVSDMIDLPLFRSLTRETLGPVPIALFFHESQLTYPDSPQLEPDLHYAFTNWTSALAADRVFFNSEYHRRVFFESLPGLLRRFPDFTHEHLIDEVVDKAEVLEVGVDLSWIEPGPQREGPVRFLWNHRWEHDKDPATFFAAVDALAAEELEFEVVVCGENFRHNPTEFAAAARRHPDRILHLGHLPVADYRRHLHAADVVVSTALQEFFGIAVVEAVAAGCMPLLPDRLSYPGLIPPEWHQDCLYERGELTARMRWALTHPARTRAIGSDLAPHMARYDWAAMPPRYSQALTRLTGEAG